MYVNYYIDLIIDYIVDELNAYKWKVGALV